MPIFESVIEDEAKDSSRVIVITRYFPEEEALDFATVVVCKELSEVDKEDIRKYCPSDKSVVESVFLGAEWLKADRVQVGYHGCRY